ncbi:sigma-54 interaction domain-containing protein [Candidatus Magnetaquicoccus inordinatus]|uniref:sigma-54 interaction domain-containing protein n=1 Tax=Candidatus Magnetaquicoccus inordinatus TaxID=2496818 RepID=UPI00102D150D|nr:sigma-54 dependent transcriptional regulator [Candidatus Magnetaquicoccus inordinatus]
MAGEKMEPLLTHYTVLLAEMDATLELRIRQQLGTLAPVKTITSKESVTTLLKQEPIGLVMMGVQALKGYKESGVCCYFDRGHPVAMVAVDGKKERLTILQPGNPPGSSLEEMVWYPWSVMRDLVMRQLQLAAFRLDGFLLHEALNAITIGIQEAVIVVDRRLKVRSVNPAARTHCRFVSAASVGFSLETEKEGCIPQLAELLRQVISNLKAELNVPLRCTLSEEAGTEIRVSATPLIDLLGHCHGAVAVVLDRSQLAETNEPTVKRQNFYRIIGSSPTMQEVYSLIESLASMDTTTLITGESGTGKEMVAEALHMKGSRSYGPLVKVNCSALSESLLESELFGHVKGAFTGAVKDRPGRFEVATGGTIFLDEIGDVSLSMQTRLLRILQERELERVGDSRTIKVDVRVVAATNKNLAELIRQGKFREDLYFRLNVVEIHLPPLRKRLEDIPLLVNHFIQKFNHKYSKSIVGVQEGVLELFTQYRWPGNIRELENAVEHAFVVCRQGLIRIKHLPATLLIGRPCADPTSADGEEEEEVNLCTTQLSATSDKQAILRALEAAHWNKKKAAALSGISRSTFYRKMEKYGIQ